MKKIFLSAAILLALHPCDQCLAQKSNSTATAKTGTAIVGKWLAVNVNIKPDPQRPELTPDKIAEIAASLVKENMVFEFLADGTLLSSTKNRPANKGKYTLKGKKLEVTDAKTKKSETYEVTVLTATDLSLNLPEENMTFIFKKK